MERFVGVEEARGQLGHLVEQVAIGEDSISLTKREALQELVRAEARDELRRRLKQVRRWVKSAGLDPSAVDEAIEAAGKMS